MIRILLTSFQEFVEERVGTASLFCSININIKKTGWQIKKTGWQIKKTGWQTKRLDGREDMQGAAGEGGVEVPHGNHGAREAEGGIGGGGDVTTVLPTVPSVNLRIFFFKS